MPADIAHVVNVSGGKDSTATYLLAIESGRSFRAVFADTGHEHPWTYDYVRALPARTGGPEIDWVKADFTEAFARRRENIALKWPQPHKGYPNGVPADVVTRALAIMYPTGNQFLDLCLLRGGFPSMKRKFCTDYLKIRPIHDQVIEPLYDQGKIVCQWLGVRRDESVGRRTAKRWQLTTLADWQYWVWRPLLDWTLLDVLEKLRQHDVPLNPLYEQAGVSRVGCWPCINAKKAEIRTVADLTPEAIDKLREWEAICSEASKSGCATFFFARDMADEGEPYDHEQHGIDAQVDWSRTSWGGKQYELFHMAKSVTDEARSASCPSLGMCE